MKLTDRIGAALAAGAWGGFIAWFGMSSNPQLLARDYTFSWRAARALLLGHDPYQVVAGTGAYPFNVDLFYPLPAAVLSLPVATLPPAVAGAIFVAVSATLLGWAVSADGVKRLGIFISAPFCMAALLGQWSIVLTAAAMIPALQFLCVAKPNIGFAAWLYRPSWRGIIGGIALCAFSLIFMPDWPLRWLESIRGTVSYRAPALSLAGCFTLLALFRWRRREGRVFLGMAFVPQLPVFYDQLPLWLVPTTMWRTLLLSATSWVAWFMWFPSRALMTQFAVARPLVLLFIYVPALVMLLTLPQREEPEPATRSPERAT
jgi:hypothetical protein